MLKISYDQALDLFDEPARAWTSGYFCGDIVAALSRKGVIYSYKELKTRQDPVLDATGTIVFAEPCPVYLRGHYLVRTEKGWMNPWSNCPVMDPAKSSVIGELPSNPTYAAYAIEAYMHDAGIIPTSGI